MATSPEIVSSEYKFGFHDDVDYLEQTGHGLSRGTVEAISRFKGEPAWMLDFRLRAYEHYLSRPMPTWGGELGNIDFEKIVYYRKPSAGEEKSWDDVPDKIKKTFERLGIPEAERKFLAGVGAQYDSEVVYHSVREELSKIGVVFMGTDQGLKEYPELFKKYFATVVPPEDNKFAALNSKVRYTTIQNWSNDVYNLVTKRAHAHANSTVEWIDANTGSRLTMKYPSIWLRGEGATAEVISVAVAGKGQHQDTGAKAIHLAPNTRSRIISKSISKDGGRTTYRGQLKVVPGATGVVASVRCDALLLDEGSRSDTYPYIDIQEDDTTMTHEATVGKISQDQVFYLMSRGLTENEAMNLVVQGFLEVFTKELPMEYAIEFNRLVKLEMEGSLG